jgi:hypothetical protein
MSNPFLILDKKCVGTFHSALGEDLVINHLVGYKVQTLIEKNVIDSIIIDSEDGFSQLGQMREFVSLDLGIGQRNIVKHALGGFSNDLERNLASLSDWLRARTPEVTLLAIPSANKNGYLKGLILCPYDGCKSYLRFAQSVYAKPYRDFIYNVTYESIAYAYFTWGARKIGLTHLSRNKYGGFYHSDSTTCQIEAVIHFCNEHKGIESISFIDDEIGNTPLAILNQFSQKPVGSHRPINKKILNFWDMDFVDLEWT